MSIGTNTSRSTLALGGVAGVDLFARGVLDLLYAGDPIAVAIGGGAIVSRYAIDAVRFTWLFGWVVLGLAVFVVTPRLFPEDEDDLELLGWARGVIGRGVLTVGTVALALSIDSALAALAVFGTSPVDAPPLALLAVFAAALVLVPVTWRLPRWCAGVPLVDCPEETGLRTGNRIRPGEVLARILLIVPFAALFLVLLSRLFPVPEVILVVLALAEMARSARSGATPTSGRKDVVERAILGLGAVWFGPEAVIALLYAVAPVFFVLYVDLRAVEMFAAQVPTEFYITRTHVDPAATELSVTVPYAFAVAYAVLGTAPFAERRRSANGLVRRTVRTARSALGGGNNVLIAAGQAGRSTRDAGRRHGPLRRFGR